MSNKNISLILICVIFLTTFLPVQVKSQIQPSRDVKHEIFELNKNYTSSDFKKIFAKSVDNESSSLIDIKKLEKENFKPVKKAGLSKGTKTALYIGIPAAIAAVIIILVVSKQDKEPDVPGFAIAGCPGNPLCQ